MIFLLQSANTKLALTLQYYYAHIAELENYKAVIILFKPSLKIHRSTLHGHITVYPFMQKKFIIYRLKLQTIPAYFM